MHSTGFRHYREVLSIPGLAGVQMTIEANGPPLADMLPALREILDRSRLMLFADSRFEELPGILRKLPLAGLYLAVPDDCIRTDAEFRSFVEDHWRSA